MSEEAFDPSPETFDDILQAVRETPRGRWFIDELSKRNRVSDTEQVLLGLERLRSAFAQPQEKTHDVQDSNRIDILRLELQQMSASIQETRREISAIKPTSNSDSRIMAATEELDAIVTSTERATTDILTSTEKLQEVVDGLRDRGFEPGACDELEELITNIFMACSFQDITGQRTTKVVNTMRYLEQRVNSMIEIWGTSQTGQAEPAPQIPEGTDKRPDAHLLNGPAKEGEGVSQDDIDRLMNGEAPANEGSVEAVPTSSKQVIQSVDTDPEAAESDNVTGYAMMEESDEALPEINFDSEELDTIDTSKPASQEDIDALFG